MEFNTWLWSIDKRWVFNIQLTHAEQIWIMPFLLNLTQIGLLLHILSARQYDDDICLQEQNYKIWFQVYLILLSVSCMCIILVFFKIVHVERLVFQKYNLTRSIGIKDQISDEKYGYWIRIKSLFTPIGFISLIIFMSQIIWVLHGIFTVQKENGMLDCGNLFKVTYLICIWITLIGLIPFVLTFTSGLLIKVTSILFAAIFPEAFINLKVRMHNRKNKKIIKQKKQENNSLKL